MSPDGGTVGQWDSRKAYDLCFFCPKFLGQWDGGTQEKHVQLGCQSILVLHSLCPQMVGWWDSGTAGKHMICVSSVPNFWDSQTVGHKKNMYS